MAKVIAELKSKTIVCEYEGLDKEITLSYLSKRNGFVKGEVDYGHVENFGTVRIQFQYAIDSNGELSDWTYEDGISIPYEIYIWETLRVLDDSKLLNK